MDVKLIGDVMKKPVTVPRDKIGDMEGIAKIIAHAACCATDTPDEFWGRLHKRAREGWMDAATAVSAWLKEAP